MSRGADASRSPEHYRRNDGIDARPLARRAAMRRRSGAVSQRRVGCSISLVSFGSEVEHARAISAAMRLAHRVRASSPRHRVFVIFMTVIRDAPET